MYSKKLAEDILESTMTANLPRISLPKAWPTHVASAVLHVISLAQFATAWGQNTRPNCNILHCMIFGRGDNVHLGRLTATDASPMLWLSIGQFSETGARIGSLALSLE